MVNAFVCERGWCIAIKGVSGMNRPIIEDERKRRQRLRMRRRRGVPQEPVGVDTGKATLYARLRKEKPGPGYIRSEEHTSELQSLMRISYAVFCLNKKNITTKYQTHTIP